MAFFIFIKRKSVFPLFFYKIEIKYDRTNGIKKNQNKDNIYNLLKEKTPKMQGVRHKINKNIIVSVIIPFLDLKDIVDYYYLI